MILVVGGTSLIGEALIHRVRDQGQEISYTSKRSGTINHLDLSEKPEKWKIPPNVHTAILCAAVTGIANCENSPEATRAINVHATQELARLLADLGARVIFLSSNLVFPPDASAPSESCTPAPATEYGRQKLAVEEFLISKIPNSQIIRPTKVVSPSLPLFLKWKDAIANQQPVEAFEDLYFSPVSLDSVAEWILKIAVLEESGIFHLSASDSISYADAAMWLLHRYSAQPSLLVKISAPVANLPGSNRLTCTRSVLLAGFQPFHSLKNLEHSWPEQK
jgi:dTDP-4-dehydrorhamnose reductase